MRPGLRAYSSVTTSINGGKQVLILAFYALFTNLVGGGRTSKRDNRSVISRVVVYCNIGQQFALV
jgi:hypothetical protein